MAGKTVVGMGIDLEIPKSDGSTEPIALFVPDVTSIGGDGEFSFELDPNQPPISFTFQELYNGIQGLFSFLPAEDFSTFPSPINSLATTPIEIKRFKLVIKNKALVTLGFEVDLQFNWTLPSTSITVKTFKMAVDYSNGSTPVVTTTPPKPVVAAVPATANPAVTAASTPKAAGR
jgi:hypothetical protein